MKIGVDIGGSHVGIGLIDRFGKIVAKKDKDIIAEIQKENYKEILVSTIVSLITELLESQHKDITKIDLIGIAVPGTVSETDIVKADNLHIKNFNIVSEINKYFNIPIQLRNDAKCAAVAEKTYGSLRKVDDAVFLTIGTGIGGAVFIDGELLRPKRYEAFEMGHMVIQKDGLKCNCGRKGCFERYASMRALKDKLYKLKGYELTNSEIKELLKNSSEKQEVEKIIDEYINDLTIGIANLINIFEPETISIGGSFVYFKDELLNRLKDKLKNGGMLFNNAKIPNIVVATLKNDAGIVGSVIL